MEKLYQEIQNQINDLMKSKLARRSDAVLLKLETDQILTFDKQKSICEEYKNGSTEIELSKKYQVGRTTINRILTNNKVKKRHAGKDPVIGAQKKQDIINGMSCQEYVSKWGGAQKSYYAIKSRIKKSLADSNQ